MPAAEGAYRLRDGSTTHDPRLDRLKPPDWRHYELFPATAATLPEKPVPVVIAIDWMSAFDSPQKGTDGRWWIGRDTTKLGYVRGGHAIAVKPEGIDDQDGWWYFYDQGSEGACVFFSSSRATTLLNRKRYVPRGGYYRAQQIDIWPGGEYPGAAPVYGGTELRAGLEVLRIEGNTPRKIEEPVTSTRWDPLLSEGISAYRWGGVDDALAALHNDAFIGKHYSAMGAVPLLNSWGRYGYPHRVWLPLETLQWLLDRDGEIGIPTDR